MGPADWGILLAGFLVGAGLFPVPAGFLARRFGSRAVSLWGVLLLGAGGLGAAAAPTFVSLVILRAVAGAGAALFFSPAIGLVASLQPPGRRGLAVGTFSSAFSAGAALGVFVTALVVPSIGWRGGLAIGGALLLGILALAVRLVPAEATPARESRPPPGIPAALRSPAVWAIGLAFVGLEGASLSAGQYFVPFAQTILGWGPALAGGVASLFVFPSLFGGPVGGALTERFTNRRTQMLLATAVCGGLLLLVPLTGFPLVAVIATIFSLSYGAIYAMMYVLAPYLPGIPRSEVPMAIGLFNSIQIVGGALVTDLFAIVVAASSYSVAWTLLAAATFVPVALLRWVPPTGALPAGATGPPA